MPTTRARATIAGEHVYLRPPRLADSTAFLAAVHASRALHRAWAQPPSTKVLFAMHVRRYASTANSAPNRGFLAFRREDDALLGVLNVSEIVRGAFNSGYIGYYGFAPWIGHGYMTEALALTLDVAFLRMKLHRIEANIQPTNARSRALVERLGFEREGYSRRYVKIAGRWRDHVRYAVLAEDWQRRRPRLRAQR